MHYDRASFAVTLLPCPRVKVQRRHPEQVPDAESRDDNNFSSFNSEGCRATPPRPSILRGFAVLPAMMSAFIRSMSAVVRLRTVKRPMSGLTCVSTSHLETRQGVALAPPQIPHP